MDHAPVMGMTLIMHMRPRADPAPMQASMERLGATDCASIVDLGCFSNCVVSDAMTVGRGSLHLDRRRNDK